MTATEISDAYIVRWGPLRLGVEPGVYGTVLQMTVLIVALDDGVEDFIELAQLVIGPLVATFAAHLFAAVLARATQRSSVPSWAEFRGLTWHAAQYLVLGVVPLLVAVVGAVSGLYTPEEAVDGLLWFGLGLLVMIGGFGGLRAGGSKWLALAGALAAGVLGMVVLALRLVLEH